MEKTDHRAIGVFDSGLGGLTAVSRLSQVLPGEDICYLGDTGRVPYGGKSRETILKYAREDIAFLLRQEIKAIVVACGTVSTSALEELLDDYALPIYGVVQPTVHQAEKATKNGKIGLIGTQATIRSGAYERKLRAINPEISIYRQACPLFVPLVENGRVHPGDIVIETIAREYLAPLQKEGVDTLMLGCTHYPLLSAVIQEIMGPEVTLISSGAATAEYVAGELRKDGLLSGNRRAGTHRYFVTDGREIFAQNASAFLQEDIKGEVQQVSLETF